MPDYSNATIYNRVQEDPPIEVGKQVSSLKTNSYTSLRLCFCSLTVRAGILIRKHIQCVMSLIAAQDGSWRGKQHKYEETENSSVRFWRQCLLALRFVCACINKNAKFDIFIYIYHLHIICLSPLLSPIGQIRMMARSGGVWPQQVKRTEARNHPALDD